MYKICNMHACYMVGLCVYECEYECLSVTFHFIPRVLREEYLFNTSLGPFISRHALLKPTRRIAFSFRLLAFRQA